MNGVSTTVIFVTAHYALHCNVFTRTGRLLDAFNDSSTRYLELEQVRYFEHTGDEPVLELPKSVLVKDNIHLAILVGEDRSSESKVFFATLERKTLSAVVALPTALVKGHVHVKSVNDAQGFLTLEAGNFFPVTSATVLGHAAATRQLPGSVVMVNREAIFSLSLERRSAGG